MEESKKVLKSDELLNTSGFFSSLGFDKTTTKIDEKKPQEKTEDKPTASDTAAVGAEDLLNASLSSWTKFSNATIVRKANDQNRTYKKATTKQLNKLQFKKPNHTKSNTTTGNINNDTTTLHIIKKEATVSSNLKKKETVIIGNMITVKEFAEKMWINLPEIMTIMIQNKILGGINTALDFDTASLIAEELGVEAKREQNAVSIEDLLEWDLNAILTQDKDSSNLEQRPPIVTIMWHVDHGKTTLLDYLRKTNIAWGEAWGITQSIWASSIIHDKKRMTFIDTPWHELFTTMRARWAKLTDIVVIVVAADDWLMPQTIESINHAKESGVPIIIAITKIDKPWANKTEQIKADLGKYDIIPEERWGDTPIINVSAVTGQWIDELLETIALQAEVLELKYNPNRSAVGVVIDAKKSAKQWIETSLIIMTGTLKVGDIIVVHNTYGKVKRMLDRTGKAIKKASWWEPILILGINDTPQPWRIAEVVKNEKEAAQKIELIQQSEERKKQSSSLQALMSQVNKWEKTTIKIIIKSDGPTSLEALEHAIDTIETPDNVEIKKVHKDIWQFTDSDIALAEASSALLIGFSIKNTASIRRKAEELKLTLKTFDIIYELTEYLEDIAMWLIEVEMEEVVTWTLKVLAIFFRKGKEMVIWWRVLEGKVTNWAEFRIIRGEEVIGKGQISSLQKDKQSVKEMTEGHECGMKIKANKKIEQDDILEFHEMQEIK